MSDEQRGTASAPLAQYGEAVRRAVRGTGLTQRQFAARVNCSESNLSEIVTGRRLPSPTLAAGISAQLGAAGAGIDGLEAFVPDGSSGGAHDFGPGTAAAL